MKLQAWYPGVLTSDVLLNIYEQHKRLCTEDLKLVGWGFVFE